MDSFGSGSHPLPLNKLSRRYNCSSCSFSTIRSRVHLYHQIVEHNENFVVYLCSFCEYASRWRCKILRHHSMAHKDLEVLNEHDVLHMKPDDIWKQYMDSGCRLETLLPRNIGNTDCEMEFNTCDDNPQHALPIDADDVSNDGIDDDFCMNNHNNTQRNADVVCGDAVLIPDGEQIEDSAIDDIAYLCPHCGNASANLVALNEHIQSHGDEAMMIPDQLTSAVPEAYSSGASINEDDSCMLFDSGGDDSLLSIDLQQPKQTGRPRQHGSNRKYRCSQCSATFNWHGDLSVHLHTTHGIERGTKKTDNSSNLYKCHYCNYQAKYQSELSRHNRLHLGVKPFQCHFCSYTSAWKGDLKRHLEAHHRQQITDDKLLNDIMSSYKNNAGTRGGVKTSSNVPVIVAATSAQPNKQASISTKLSMTSPSTVIGSLKCGLCSYLTNDYEHFRLHLRNHQGQPPYFCSNCEETFFLSHEADQHVKEYHSSDLNAHVYNLQGEQARIIKNEDLRAFMCSECGVRFNSYKEVEYHCQANHPDVDFVIICLDDEIVSHSTCSSAKYPTKSKTKPTVYKTSKTYSAKAGIQGNRPFRCSVCGHRSNWKWDINKHIKVAHPQTRDAFTETLSPEDADSTIEAYMREVKGKVKEENAEGADGYNRPYRCTGCGHRSNWKWDVRKHIRVAHSDLLDVYVETLSNEEAKSTLDDYMSSRRSASSICNDACSSPRLDSNPSSVYGNSPRVDQLRLKRFKCSICGYRSNYRSDLVRHNKRKHSKMAEVIILSVEDATTSLSEYAGCATWKNHINGTEEDYQSSADDDSSTTDDTKLYKWQCFICSVTTDSDQLMIQHIDRFHPSVKSYCCNLCSFSSHHEAEVKQHMIRHDKNSALKYNCRFRKVPYTMITRISQQSNCCVICSTSFLQFSELIDHYRSQHAVSDEDVALLAQPNIKTDPCDVIQCKQCPFETIYPKLFAVHSQLHQNQLAGCQFHCQYCSYKATSIRFLRSHEYLHVAREVNHDNQDKPTPEKMRNLNSVGKAVVRFEYFHCLFCPWFGNDKKSWLVHKQFHRRISESNKHKLVMCDKCNFACREPRQLRNHAVVHVPKYSTKRRTLLKKHAVESEDFTLLVTAFRQINEILERYSTSHYASFNLKMPSFIAKQTEQSLSSLSSEIDTFCSQALL